MLQYILRNGVLVVALLSFFSNSIAAASDGELAKKFSKAQRLATQGQVMQAITVYQSLIRSNPQLPEAYNNLAALYLKQKNTKQAKHILEQGLRAHKGYGALYEGLTTINVAMAREAYSKALQIDLKPSAIIIASLSLNDRKLKNIKDTTVISRADKPLENKQLLITKSFIEDESVIPEKTRISSERKDASVTNSDKKSVQAVTRQTDNTEEVETLLQAWSAAWAAQAVDMYLSFYHKHYKPSNGLSHKDWVQSRRYRLKKPHWIKIGLSDFKVKKNTGKQVVVNFKQLYESSSFRDMSSKQIVLLYTDNGWRIFREKSL